MEDSLSFVEEVPTVTVKQTQDYYRLVYLLQGKQGMYLNQVHGAVKDIRKLFVILFRMLVQYFDLEVHLALN